MNDIIKNLESRENATNNDWRTVELEIKYLYEQIKSIVVGETSFESITGLPEDNAALKAVLDGKANEVDLQTLQGLVETLQTAISNVYTKTETDTLLADKADKSDTYTKTEVDTLLDDKADQDDLDTLNNTVSDIQEELADKVDKETGKSLMEDTLPGEVADNRTDIEELKLKVQDIQIIQMRTIPTPSADYLGKIVQYIGPTVEAYTNGYFYQCDYDTDLADYTWIQKMTQPAGEVDLSNYYTKTETDNLLQNKQEKLTAGEGIKITGNVIMQDIINDTLSSPQTTWSSRYLESLFHSLSGLSSIEIVDSRPATPVNNTLYYIKAYEEGEDPLYEIWFYSNNTWTNFGTTAIDLTNYYTKTEVDALLANKQTTLTPGQGIDITNNNISAKIDGTTLGINDAGNMYVKSGGGGGGGGFEPTSAQLAAMNSGITQAKREGYDTAIDDISDLKTRMTTAEGDIDNLETDLDDKQDKIEDHIISTAPEDTDFLSDLNETTNNRWSFGNIWLWVKGKITSVYYPVGTVIFNTGTNPGTAFGGTWSLYATGTKALYLDATAETAISEELPDITGSYNVEIISKSVTFNGAFKDSSVNSSGSRDVNFGSGNKNWGTINFKASNSNSVYKTNGKVRAEGITICAWKRTA